MVQALRLIVHDNVTFKVRLTHGVRHVLWGYTADRHYRRGDIETFVRQIMLPLGEILHYGQLVEKDFITSITNALATFNPPTPSFDPSSYRFKTTIDKIGVEMLRNSLNLHNFIHKVLSSMFRALHCVDVGISGVRLRFRLMAEYWDNPSGVSRAAHEIPPLNPAYGTEMFSRGVATLDGISQIDDEQRAFMEIALELLVLKKNHGNEFAKRLLSVRAIVNICGKASRSTYVEDQTMIQGITAMLGNASVFSGYNLLNELEGYVTPFIEGRGPAK